VQPGTGLESAVPESCYAALGIGSLNGTTKLPEVKPVHDEARHSRAAGAAVIRVARGEAHGAAVDGLQLAVVAEGERLACARGDGSVRIAIVTGSTAVPVSGELGKATERVLSAVLASQLAIEAV
jgi:hypothetical protein